MHGIFEKLLGPWPWYAAGPLIALVMTLLLLLGRHFGLSSNLRTLCSLAGAGRCAGFFRFDWRGQLWNLVFVAGAIGGAALMRALGSTASRVEVAPAVAARLAGLGIDVRPDWGPALLFGSGSGLPSAFGIATLAVGGFLVGFGARWAGGCTSGHAISGLSDLQKGSLIAVLGFFAGGLAMTWFILPLWLRVWGVGA
jgi:uncharacterized membrane protein YedE/YeeE